MASDDLTLVKRVMGAALNPTLTEGDFELKLEGADDADVLDSTLAVGRAGLVKDAKLVVVELGA